MQDKTSALIPEAYYHIYNRANGDEVMFRSEENYQFFLNLIKIHVMPFAEILSYCLMPNHFHFIIKVRNENEIKSLNPDLTGFENLSGLISKRFSNLFNSYTEAFNKMYNHKGSLFMRPYKRKRITEMKYLIELIQYIHQNPVAAGLILSQIDWKYWSFRAITSEKSTLINREEVLDIFDSLENFLFVHSKT